MIINGNGHKGFTLVEVLVFLFLFALISVVFLQTYAIGTRLIINSKNRLGATALANQKMEIVRSVSYASIGTKHWTGAVWVYGIPAGDLLEDETVDVNTTRYQVHTFIQYVDDAFDGKVGSGDLIPNDYKRARITVEWGSGGDDQSVVIFGNFSPNGVETTAGGGVLSINVLDGSGAGVTDATVHVTNSSASIDLTADTDSTGNIMLPGAPIGSRQYVIAVSKDHYYSVTTYAPFPTSAFNPNDFHASVVANTLNQKTMVMDRSSAVTLTTRDFFGTTIPSSGFTIIGGRIIGHDAVTAANVYGFSQTATTDGSGRVMYPDESAGQYTVTVTVAGYELYKLSPEGTTVNGFTALAGTPAQITAILLNQSIGSALIMVQKQSDSSVIAGASVTLSNAGLGYSQTVTTDQYGYAYFSTALSGLTAATYDIAVTMSGYSNVASTIAINGTLQKKAISMSN